MTPAVTVLERNDVSHRVLTYDHDPTTTAFGDEAAAALDLDPDTVFKTLVATVDAMEVVAVVPVSTRLDLKALAKAAGGKKAAMANQVRAERLTGYVLGGISPLGQRKKLTTFVDASARGLELICVSGGRRGLEIELAPDDLVALADGTYAAISTT